MKIVTRKKVVKSNFFFHAVLQMRQSQNISYMFRTGATRSLFLPVTISDVSDRSGGKREREKFLSKPLERDKKFLLPNPQRN